MAALPLSAATFEGADLAPASTVFYSEIPSLQILDRNFLLGHMQVAAVPIFRNANRGNQNSPLLDAGPALSSPVLSSQVNLALCLMQAEHLFNAFTPAPEKGLRFLEGGRVPDPRKALEIFKARISEKSPGLSWQESDSQGTHFSKTTLKGIGAFHLAAHGKWILVATDTEALADAVATLRDVKRKSPSLSKHPAWRSNIAAQSPNPLFIYFTQVQNLAPVLEKSGLMPHVNLLRTRLSGVEAFSWTWNSGGAGSKASDRLVTTLSPSTAAALEQILEPLDDEPDPLIGVDTVHSFAFRARLEELLRAPAVSGLAITELGKQWLTSSGRPEASEKVDVLLLVDHPDESPRAAWILRLARPQNTGDIFRRIQAHDSKAGPKVLAQETTEALFLIVADDVRSARYFQERVKEVALGKETRFSSPLDRLPLLGESFLEMRMDRLRIAQDYLAALKRNAGDWIPALKERGVALPDSFANFQPESWLGPVRLSCALHDEQLILDNAFQLRGSASTCFTQVSVLAVQAYGPEILEAMHRWESLFQPPDGPGDSANLFRACMESYLLFGPYFRDSHTYLLGLDLMAHYRLIAPPALKAK